MKTSILVQNLKCGGCANTIYNKISSMENILNVNVDVEASKVSFEYSDELDALNVKERLKSIGYPSIEELNSLTSKTKSFMSCATGKLSNKKIENHDKS